MKIAFATLNYDARDVTRGSGTYFHMSREIERFGHTVHYIGPVSLRYPWISRLLRRTHRQIGRQYRTHLDPFIGRRVGQEVTQRLATLDYDILLTNDYLIAGNTSTEKPIVLYTDAMLTVDYIERKLPNSHLGNLSPVTLALARRTIRRGLDRADRCIFPAQWSADEALRYGCDPEKIAVIPFGANLEDPGQQAAASRDFASQARQCKIELLFIGKDWLRKGGPIAVTTTEVLRRRGINARLHIVGHVLEHTVAEYIVVHGLLNKDQKDDQKRLDRLLRECDALILPSSAEGFVIAPVEAAAYGMPSLAYDTIGVSSAVSNGKSGILLPLGASANEFADVIAGWFVHPELYDQLVRGARKHYEETANWHTAVTILLNAIEGLKNTCERRLRAG